MLLINAFDVGKFDVTSTIVIAKYVHWSACIISYWVTGTTDNGGAIVHT